MLVIEAVSFLEEKDNDLLLPEQYLKIQIRKLVFLQVKKEFKRRRMKNTNVS